jgi:transcriptional regulator with XRE-family HTH domain
LSLSAEQIRAGRALLGWSAQQLADRVGVSIHTIQRLETGKVPIAKAKFETITGIRQALEDGGVSFLTDGYGVTKRQP